MQNRDTESIEFWAMIGSSLSVPHILADASIVLPAPTIVRTIQPVAKGNGLLSLEVFKRSV
jgi:hypothetical protein